MLGWIAASGLGGCVPDEEASFAVTTETFLPAEAGSPYDMVMSAEGGVEPYRWWLSSGSLPVGLTLDESSGRIEGVPMEVGVTRLSVRVDDALGATASRRMPLTVGPNVTVATCGTPASGVLVEGMTHWTGNLHRYSAFRWVELDPPPGTTRVAWSWSGPVPGFMIPGGDPHDQREDGFWWPRQRSTFVLDGNSYPALDSYGNEPLRLLVLDKSGGPWSVTPTCSSGPVLRRTRLDPTRLDEEVDLQLEVLGDASGARFEALDDLPAGLTLDPASGRIRGRPTELGTVTFDVRTELASGLSRVEPVSIGVYEPVQVACGKSVAFEMVGSIDLDEMDPWDVAAWRSFETPLDASITSLTVEAEADTPIGLTIVDPWQPPFALESVHDTQTTAPFGLAQARVDVDGWPEVPRFVERGNVRIAVLSFAGGHPSTSGTLTVTCGDGPRPMMESVPLLVAGEFAEWSLAAAGGTPPYEWSATELPKGAGVSRKWTVVDHRPPDGWGRRRHVPGHRCDGGRRRRGARGPCGNHVRVLKWSLVVWRRGSLRTRSRAVPRLVRRVEGLSRTRGGDDCIAVRAYGAVARDSPTRILRGRWDPRAVRGLWPPGRDDPGSERNITSVADRFAGRSPERGGEVVADRAIHSLSGVWRRVLTTGALRSEPSP